ncbi:uncharacterized protein I303_102659 [Kwoniella dejecticola CBS 10117]|uniref:Uncharacterized protein n=1 Tax=Kwoniella dejecticola CBS 10117 TaxID=1296121 RepID=A0A1A6A9D7_9TREE|nr:uncharacterized protein I303_02674 [Kwoniella dejecticola CBS 10117]OBR86663.1 hypothetical protein I303_02674 [Kwoniella dejecticola CBS 10117]
MPPLFTSTSWTTLVRKAATAIMYAPKPAVAIKAAPKRTINNIHKARQVVHQVIQSSFPSLSTPAHQLNYATIPIRTSARGFTSSTKPSNLAKRLGPVRQGLQSAGSRPRWVNGPSIPANVGLGKARNFSSAPHMHAMQNVNVPMVFRAFASLLDDDEKKFHSKGLPRASRYTPYSKSKLNRRQRKARVSSYSNSIDSSIIEDLKHYFPIPTRSSGEITVALPLEPELLVTEGKTTILALPLSPSLEALLAPMAQIPYNETSIGISILAKLTQGLFPIHNAFSLHSSTRVIPLLTKLDGLGVLDQHPGLANTQAEVVHDQDGQPDILRLIFADRSVSDVKTLLGESLRPNEEGEWWALYEDRRQPEHEPERKMELNQVESREIMEQWETNQSKTSNSQDSMSLVFPTLDMSANRLEMQEENEVLFDNTESVLSTPNDSWSSSGSTTPSPIDSPSSDESMSSLSFSSSTESLTASLLSKFSDESNNGQAQSVWSVHPSESDSDVESSFSEAEEWSAVEHLIPSAPDDVDGDGQGEVMVTWSGSGEGFGFLAQPW